MNKMCLLSLFTYVCKISQPRGNNKKVITKVSSISNSIGRFKKFSKLLHSKFNNFFNFEGRIMRDSLLESTINYLNSVENRILYFNHLFVP